MGTTTTFPSVRNLFVCYWAERPVATAVKAFVDRFMFTDVGVGGSEWYSDGTRWRAVGGQVTVIKLGAQTAINGSTATSDTTQLIDSPATTCKIPAGLFQIGDKISIESYMSKPNATTPVASNAIRYRLGTNGSGSDAIIGTSSAILSTNRTISELHIIEPITDTSARKWVDFTASGYLQATNLDTPVSPTLSFSNTTQYLTVTSGLAAGTVSDTLQLLSFTVTIKTCG